MNTIVTLTSAEFNQLEAQMLNWTVICNICTSPTQIELDICIVLCFHYLLAMLSLGICILLKQLILERDSVDARRGSLASEAEEKRREKHDIWILVVSRVNIFHSSLWNNNIIKQKTQQKKEGKWSHFNDQHIQFLIDRGKGEKGDCVRLLA